VHTLSDEGHIRIGTVTIAASTTSIANPLTMGSKVLR
jgi:hypothetical protein